MLRSIPPSGWLCVKATKTALVERCDWTTTCGCTTLIVVSFDMGSWKACLFPRRRSTWGCMMRIPAAIAHQMEMIYRNALAASHPLVQDDNYFRAAFAAAHARWHLFQVLHRLPSCLIQDAPRGPTT